MAAVTAAVVATAATAYGAYSSNKAQKDAARQNQAAAEAASGPRTTTPYAPAEEEVRHAIAEARRLYDQGLNQQAANKLRGVPGASEAFKGLVGDVVDRAGNPSATLQAGQGYVQDVLGSGTDPDAPFARNSILNDLNSRLGGADFGRSQDLLAQFISGGGGAGFTPSGGTAARQVGASSTPAAAEAAAARGEAMTPSSAALAVRSGAPGGVRAPAAGIPDTMARGGFFADETRKFFDPSRLDPANDPTLAPYVDALEADLAEAFGERADLIGDRFSAANTFNSSARGLALGEASGEMDRALASELARVYMGSRQEALAAQERLLGQVSNRDVAAMADATNRYGISSAAGSAAAGNAAAQERLEAQLAFEREALGANTDLTTRAQNLQAILGLGEMDRFGLGMLGDLGGQLSGEQANALGAIPGLEGVEQDWYGQALAGQGGVDAANRAAASSRNNAAAQRALAPGADLDDYLRRIMGPAAAFSTTQGPAAYAPGYSGPSSAEAVAAGLLGGAASGLGTYGQFKAAGF